VNRKNKPDHKPGISVGTGKEITRQDMASYFYRPAMNATRHPGPFLELVYRDSYFMTVTLMALTATVTVSPSLIPVSRNLSKVITDII